MSAKLSLPSDKSEKNKLPSFKVIVLGSSSVGKTCLISRFVNDDYLFDQATLGTQFEAKNVKISIENATVESVRLQIWDTAGSEEFKSLSQTYYKGSSAIILVYDSTSRESFEALDYWVNEIMERVDLENALLVLTASKVDMVGQEQITPI